MLAMEDSKGEETSPKLKTKLKMKLNNILFNYVQGIGDTGLGQQCFRLTLASNNDHAEAYNNLGVLELRKGHVDQVRTISQLP